MNRFAIAAGVLSAIVLSVSGAFGQAERSLNACQTAVARESSRYIQVVAATLDRCLNRMSAEVLYGGDTAAAATKSAAACVRAFRRFANSDDPSKQISNQFDTRLGMKCDPTANPKLSHAESDTYTIGASTLSAANQNQFCQTFGGDGSVDSFAEWRDCLRAAAHCQALQTAATSWPRLLEYLAVLRTAMAALPATTQTADALSALQAIESAIEGPTDDNVPELACGQQGPSAYHSDLPGEVVTLAGLSLQAVASIPLAAGRHMLWAKVQITPVDTAGGGIECFLGEGRQSYEPTTRDTVTFLGHIALSAAGSATLRCRALGGGEYSIVQQEASAIAVDSIDVQSETQPSAGNGASGYYKDATGVTATLQGPTLQPLAGLSLPAGSYLLWANVRAQQLGAPGSGIECVLGNATQRHDPRAAGSALATFMGEITLPAPGTAIVECSAVGGGAYSAESVAMSAVRIGTIESTVQSADTPQCQNARMYWENLLSRPQDLCGILRDEDVPETSPIRMYTDDFWLLLPELTRKFPGHSIEIRNELAGWRFTELCGPDRPQVQLTVKQRWIGFSPNSGPYSNYFFTLIGSYDVDPTTFDEDRPWAHLNDRGIDNPAWSLFDTNIDEFNEEVLFNLEDIWMPYVVRCP